MERRGGGGGGGGCYCGGHTLVNFSLHTTQSVQILQLNNNHREREIFGELETGDWREKRSTFPNLSSVNGRSCLTIHLAKYIHFIGGFLNPPNVVRFSQFSEYRGIYSNMTAEGNCIIDLNVGGLLYTTSIQTLTKVKMIVLQQISP